MTTPHHILTLARTSAFALVYAWMCLSACIGMSASAWAIPHAHADTKQGSGLLLSHLMFMLFLMVEKYDNKRPDPICAADTFNGLFK